MNKAHLQKLFDSYVKHFEYLTDTVHDENYKWRAIKFFQDNFDIDALDFPTMLAKATSETCNLINDQTQPLYGIIECAKKEPETVRNLFKDLYKEDNGDLILRQNKIEAFIDSSEKLKEKYFPGSWRYKQTQRSAMAYLMLRYPDDNFFYKYTEVTEFADCVEFYSDFANRSKFGLSLYYKMCEELIEQIRKHKALMEKHHSRFMNQNNSLYQDENLHTLAFDIIYTSQAYNFYDGITYTHLDSKAKKEYLKKEEKAEAQKAKLDDATKKLQQLNEAKQKILSLLSVGMKVRNLRNGEGIIQSYNDKIIIVLFDGQTNPKKFGFLKALVSKHLEIDSSELRKYIEENITLLKQEEIIQSVYNHAVQEFSLYMKYLN